MSTALTRMPCPPRSLDDALVIARPAAASRGKNFEVQIGDPLLVGNLIDPCCRTPARVIHQPIEAAPPGEGRIDEPFKVSQMGDIGLHRKHVTPGVP